MRHHIVIWLLLVGMLVQNPVNLPQSATDNATPAAVLSYPAPDDLTQLSAMNSQSCLCKGHKRHYNWYFGDNAGFTFMTDPVSILGGSQMVTAEATSVLSDEDGNLLLYTNGEVVWNGNHQVVLELNDLFQSSVINPLINMSAMGAVLVPAPGNDNLVYFFGVTPHNAIPLFQMLFYATIDLNANGGIGAPTGLATVIDFEYSEKILPICKSDGSGFWLLVPKAIGTTATGHYTAINLTSTGVTTQTVNAGLLTLHSPGAANNTMAASLNGDRVAVMIWNSVLTQSRVQVFDFNQVTGQLSNPVDIFHNQNANNTLTNYLPQSVAFSPSGRFLYVVDYLSGNPAHSRLLQYDLEAANVNASQVMITGNASSSAGGVFGAMQNAPDGKIYIARRIPSGAAQSHVAIIHHPNIKGLDCNLEMTGLTYNSTSAAVRFGLPNFPVQWNNYNRAEFTYADTCLHDFTQFYLVDSTSFETGWTVIWNFNDPAGVTLNSGPASGNFSPRHQFSTSGPHTVSAIVSYGPNCPQDTFIQEINILHLPEFSLGPDITLCHDHTMQLTAPPGYLYAWYQDGVYTGVNTQQYTVSEAGNYEVLVTHPADPSCTVSASIQISYFPMDVGSFTTHICYGDSYFFGNSLYSASTTVTHTFINQNGCDSTVTMTLIVRNEALHTPDVTLCYDESISFNGVTYNQSGFYTDTIPGGSFHGCDSIIHLQLNVLPQPLLIVTDTICYGETIQYGGQTLSVSGSHVINLPAAGYFNCDSTIQVDLTVLPPSELEVDTTVCAGEWVEFGGQQFGVTASYPIVLPGAGFYGCDSMIYLSLTVLDEARFVIHDSLCYGGSLTLAGEVYDEAGIWFDTLQGMAYSGCDSIIELHLFIYDQHMLNIDTTLCFGESITLGGITYSQAGVYEDTLWNSAVSGCDSIIFLQLAFYDEIVLDLGPDIELCEPESETIGTNLSGSFLWSTGETGAFIDVWLTGEYSLIYTSPDGCVAMDTVEVTVFPLPQPQISGPGFICEGDTVTLTAEQAAGLYTWSTGATGQQIQVHQAGIYSVTVYDPNGCSNSVSHTLAFHPQPVVSITSADTLTICIGDSIWLEASGTSGDFYWSTGASSQGIWVSMEGQYDVMLVDGNDCIATDTVFVQWLPVPDTVVIDSMLCFGEGLGVDTFWVDAPGTYWFNLIALNGCDSIVEVSLNWHPVYADTLTAEFCAGDSLWIEGNYLTSSGMHTFNYSTVNGCDSVVNWLLTMNPVFADSFYWQACAGDTLWLENTAVVSDTMFEVLLQSSASCDSLVWHSVQFVEAVLDSQSHFICPGDSIFAQGDWQLTEGIYIDTFQTSFGCDSIVIATLIWHESYEIFDTAMICTGDSVWLQDNWQMNPGSFTDVYSTIHGCDSIVHTTLWLLPVYEDTLPTLFICEGDSVLAEGEWISAPGLYAYHYTSVNGCDSIVYAEVSQWPVYSDTVEISACAGEEVVLHDEVFYTDTVVYHAFTTIHGCDSIVQYSILFNPESFTQQELIICTGDSVMLGGAYQHVSGVFYDTLSNQFGCDSVVETTLTVLDVIETFEQTDICYGDSVWIHGSWESTAGVYTQSFISAAGCDSIATITVDVWPVYHDTSLFTICAYDSIWVHDNWINTSGTYTGNFTSVHGCDSVSTAIVTVLVQEQSDQYYYGCVGDPLFFQGNAIYTDTIILQVSTGSDGCNVLSWHHFVFYPVHNDTLFISLCSGDSLLVNGIWQTESGIYTEWNTSFQGCDSIVVFDLQIEESIMGFASYGVCANDSLLIQGQYLSAGDTLVTFWQSAGGCDSIMVETAFALPVYSDTIIAEICTGDSFLWHGSDYELPGFYEHFMQSSQGCDSIQVLNLITVLPDTTVVDTLFTIGTVFAGSVINQDTTIILSAPGIPCPHYVLYQITASPLLYESDTLQLCLDDWYLNWQVSGDSLFVDTLQSASGIDSVVVSVFIQAGTPGEPIEFFHAVCFGDSIFGMPAYTHFIHTDTFTGSNACDSIHIHHVTVMDPDTGYTDVFLCPGAEFYGNSWDADSVFQLVYPTAWGCDSVHIYDVQILPQHSQSDTVELCAGAFYFGQPHFLPMDTSLMYINQFGCDSIIHMHIMVHSPDTVELYVDVCYGGTILGTVITSDTILTESQINQHGCDSTTIRNISVIDILYDTLMFTGCPGSVWQGIVIDSDTSWSETQVAASGCDSITTYIAYIWPELPLTTVSMQLCYGEQFNGQAFFQDSVWTEQYQNINGCDSIVEVSVQVLPVYEATVEWWICPGDSLLGQVFFAPDTVPELLTTQHGCDSLIIHHVHLFEVFEDTMIWQVCPGSFVDGVEIFYDSLWSVNHVSSQGCDSIVWHWVEVTPQYADTFSYELCAGSLWNGIPVSADTVVTENLLTTAGCDSIVVHILTVNPLPEVNITGADLICEGATSTLTADGNFVNAEWSNAFAGNAITVSDTGWYTVTVTGSQGCIAIDSIYLAWSPPIVLDTVLVQNASSPFSQDGALGITVSGGTGNLSVLWDGGLTSQTLTSLAPGLYCVTVTDQIGCESTNCYTIISPDTLKLSMSTGNLLCFEDAGGLIDMVVNGGVAPYNWQYQHTTQAGFTGSGTISEEGMGLTITNLIAGTYELIITDALGITLDTTLNILQPDPLSVVLLNTDSVSCSGLSDGSLQVQILGGTQPYQVSWSQGQYFSSGTLSQSYHLPVGEVIMTATDANGCTLVQSFVVPGPLPLTLHLEWQDADCYGGNNGSAAVFVQGGTLPYQYTWSTGHTGSIATALSAGMYQVTVTDAKGCMVIGSAQISEGLPMEVFVTATPVSCFMYGDGVIHVDSVRGGEDPYLYTLAGEMVFTVNPTFENLFAGSYEVLVQDVLGCESSVTVQITQPGEFIISLVADHNIIGLGDTAIVDVLSNQGWFHTVNWSPHYNYTWLDSGTIMVYPHETTTYWLHAENTNGCPSASSITILVDPQKNIFVPNIFSPGSMSGNDVFTLYTGPDVEIIRQFRVYTRWGELVHFRQNLLPDDPELGWHGNINGTAAGSGVYVYMAEILMKNGETVVLEGHVTLLR